MSRFPGYDQCGAVGNTIGACEDSVAGAKLFQDSSDDFEGNRPPASSAADIKAGLIIPAVDYIRATQQRRVLQASLCAGDTRCRPGGTPDVPDGAAPYGALPARPGPSVHGATMPRTTRSHSTCWASPRSRCRAGSLTAGSPIGLQFIARPFDEATALRAAYAYEQATPWHARHPPLTGLAG